MYTPPEAGLALVSFDLNLPPGKSVIQARYRAKAVGTDEGRPAVTWQILYLLAPASTWGGFQRLDVSVLVPSGWECNTQPLLRRDGDRLFGTFHGLPSDILRVSVRLPVSSKVEETVMWHYISICFVLVVGSLPPCVLLQFRTILRRRLSLPPWCFRLLYSTVALGAMLAVCALCVWLTMATLDSIDSDLRRQESPYFSYKLIKIRFISYFLCFLYFFSSLFLYGQSLVSNSPRQRQGR
jgi:hypothetical protein